MCLRGATPLINPANRGTLCTVSLAACCPISSLRDERLERRQPLCMIESARVSPFPHPLVIPCKSLSVALAPHPSHNPTLPNVSPAAVVLLFLPPSSAPYCSLLPADGAFSVPAFEALTHEHALSALCCCLCSLCAMPVPCTHSYSAFGCTTQPALRAARQEVPVRRKGQRAWLPPLRTAG